MEYFETSISMLTLIFNHSLHRRGFTRSIHLEMLPNQESGIQKNHFALLGIVLAGEIELEYAEVILALGQGEEFKIPANTFFQVKVGQTGAQILVARKRHTIVEDMEISDNFDNIE